MINKALAIKSLRPNVEWSMNDDDVENIIWHTEGVEPLTEKEVQDEIIRLEQVEKQKQDNTIAAKESALNKLSALGLTEEEIKALIRGI
jgi:hypothetical protein